MKRSIVSVIVIFSLLISALAVFPQAASADGLPFRDVKAGDWFYSSVARVYGEGIIIGLKPDAFAPNDRMTRAQLVTIICRLSGDEFAGLGSGLTFKDTPGTDWYADYVGWAVREGVVAGYPDGTFKPNAPVTRAELAAVLARFFKNREIYFAEAPLIAAFTDAEKIADWAKESVEAIRLCGIISGDPKGNFNPGSSATRAEIATMITRYLDAERISKAEYLMDHYLDYLPHAGKYVTLEFSLAKFLTAEGFASRMFPYFGISEDEYEIVTNEEELSELRNEWVKYTYGDVTVATLNFALAEKSTGVTSKTVAVRLRIKKVEEHFYIDPDDFDPGIDGAIYSTMISTALSYEGNTARLYRALDKGKTSGKLTVAYIGGSITEGASAMPDGGYARISANWLERHVASDLTFINAGISGTNSALGNARLGRDVLEKNPDIIFVEFAANDDPYDDQLKEQFESMVRTALKSEGGPAVVIVVSRGGDGTLQAKKAVAEKYGIPIVDVTTAVAYGIEQNAFTDKEFRPDGTHPDDWGHQIMSDMIEELFRRTLGEFDSAEAASATIEPVPDDSVTASRFEGLKMIEGEDLNIVSQGSFKFTHKDRGYGFARAATAASGGKDPLVFIVTCKMAELVIESGTGVLVSVDGGDPIPMGSGSYFADAYPLFLTDEVLTHTITVTPFFDDAEAVILAAAYN